MSRPLSASRLWLVIVCLVPALPFLALGQEKTGPAEKTAPPRAGKLRPAAKSSLKPPPVVLTRCRIKLIDDVTLASGRTGILAFVKPSEGASVKKGEQVAGLKDEVPRATYNVAEKESSNDVEVRYSIKASELADAEHDKALIANRQLAGTVPDIEVKKLKLAAERGVLQIEKAEHDFEIVKLKRDESREMLNAYQIIAPFDGVVTKVLKANGEAVREGDPILELANTTRVRVEGYVNIKDVWNIVKGCPVKVQLDIPEVDLPVEQLTFEGRVVFVDVKVEPVTREVRLWAEVANRENVLRSGLTAKMTIEPSGVSPAQAAANPEKTINQAATTGAAP